LGDVVVTYRSELRRVMDARRLRAAALCGDAVDVSPRSARLGGTACMPMVYREGKWMRGSGYVWGRGSCVRVMRKAWRECGLKSVD